MHLGVVNLVEFDTRLAENLLDSFASDFLSRPSRVASTVSKAVMWACSDPLSDATSHSSCLVSSICTRIFFGTFDMIRGINSPWSMVLPVFSRLLIHFSGSS